MGSESAKVRVLIPTTAGVVEVLLLAEEDPVIGRSVACIGGTTQVADIDAGYHAFVARPTGVVERLFGHSCYRLDVSGRIDAGSSWQLGILVAHALHAEGRLAQEGDAAECVVWATGTVRSVDLSVGAVSHVADKLDLSLDRLQEEARAGRRVVVAVPAQNAPDASPRLRERLAALGIEVLEVGALAPLWKRLGLAPGLLGEEDAPRPSRARAIGYVGRVVRRRPGASWRQPLPWAAAAALLLVLLAGAAVRAWWPTDALEVAYYHALVWRWGLPEGLGRLDAETRMHRFSSYRIAKRRGRVAEVRLENSAGAPRIDEDGYARWVVHYRETGKAEKIEVYRPNGQLKREERHDWSGGKLIVTFAHGSSPQAQAGMQAPAMQGVTGNSDIVRHELKFDSYGLVIERRYQNAWGTPVKNAQGSFGQRLAYTPSGLVQRRAEIDADGAEITLKSGVRAVVTTYDRQDRLVRRTLVGSDGRPFDSWYTSLEVEHDRWGNPTATRYFGTDGKPAAHADGIVATAHRYDARGNVVEQAYLDADGRPAPHQNLVKVVATHDAHGNTAEETFLDADGRPTLHEDGYAKAAYRYDVRGNIVEQAYFGLDGKPTIAQNGYAKAIHRYDANGNLTDAEYLGTDGMAAATRWGFARVSRTYDARGNLTRSESFGIDGKAVLGGDGLAKTVYVYDARGNPVERSYFGVDGKPALHKEGFAKLTVAYDTRGNPTDVAYFGVDGSPTLHETGIARFTLTYDARGNAVGYAYFGVDGKPTLNKDGYAKLTAAYDARGNLAERAHFGIDGKPALDKENGTWRSVYLFDARGNGVRAAYFGVDGEPTLHKDGYATAEATYNARGLRVEATYFGVDGKPTLHKDGYAKATFAYNARGLAVEAVYFGVDGKPALMKHGIAKATVEYDARGQEIERRFFGVDGAPALLEGLGAKVRFVRDPRGYVVNAEYFDLDNRPVAVAAAVDEINPTSLAYQIGFRNGDRVIAYRGGKVTSGEHFGYLRAMPPFGDAAITILRGTERLTLVAPAGRQLDLKLKNVAAAARTAER
jgi:hypothetical protein